MVDERLGEVFENVEQADLEIRSLIYTPITLPDQKPILIAINKI